MLAWIATFLTFYYTAYCARTRQWKYGLFALTYGLLSFYLFIVLPRSFDPLLITIAALIPILLHFLPALFSSICLAVYFSLVLFAILFTSFSYLSQEKPIAKVVIHGKQVYLEDAQGLSMGSYELEGDLVGIRVRTIRVNSFFHFLGFFNACRIESITNGYLSIENHNRLPHKGYAIPLRSPAWDYLWRKLFLQNWAIPGIKSALLQSQYLPLQDGAYYITVTRSGISCVLVSN